MVKLTTFASFVLALSALLALTPRHPAPASPDSVPQDDSASVSYTEFSAPGAGTTAYLGTTATAINTGNEVVGFYLDSQTVYHGYLPGLGGPALSGLVALSCFNKVSALP